MPISIVYPRPGKMEDQESFQETRGDKTTDYKKKKKKSTNKKISKKHGGGMTYQLYGGSSANIHDGNKEVSQFYDTGNKD